MKLTSKYNNVQVKQKGSLPSYAKQNEILEILKHLAKEGRYKDYPHLKIYFKGKRVGPLDMHSFMPSGEKNLENYLENLEQVIGENSFLLFMNDFSKLGKGVPKGLAQAFDKITADQGISTGICEPELFLGKYGLTPGGIHRETCLNVHQSIFGTKRIYAWFPEFFRNKKILIEEHYNKTDRSFDQFLCLEEDEEKKSLKEAIVLTPKAGETMIIPPLHWHVGESTKMSVSINLAFYPSWSSSTAIEKLFDNDPKENFEISNLMKGESILSWAQREGEKIEKILKGKNLKKEITQILEKRLTANYQLYKQG